MFDTPSVFDSLALDDTDARVAQRRALALAQTRVENRMGSFLRGARSEEEFEQRLALLMDDFQGAVRTASTEVGYDTPEFIESALKEHYAAAVEFEEVPAEEEEDESDSKASSVNSDATPRTASVKAGEWLLTPHTGAKHHMDGVTDKEDRQYEHIKEQYLEDGKDEDWAKEMAARTVNKGKGSSFLAGSWTITAGDTTGLGGPEPKIDKSHKPLNGPPAGAEPDKKVDPIEPIPFKNRTEDGHDLEMMGDVTEESLPAASGDDSGFSTATPGGKGEGTKTFPKGDQASPVTHETISSSEFPSDEAVRSALTRL